MIVNNGSGRTVIPSTPALKNVIEVEARGQSLPMIKNGISLAGQLTRREMVQRLLAGAGAGAAWPVVAASHPIHEHLKNDATLAQAEKLEAAKDWKPIFLNAQQNEALTALAESLVPGSTRAKVSCFIDLLLSVDNVENQRKFLQSLAAFQEEAQKRFGKGFPALTEDQKNALLSDAATKVKSKAAAETNAAKQNSVIHVHFENLKGWVSGAYYSSEIGMRELGWTGEYAFAEFPGCKHAGEHT